jgi:hypothetical protein
MTLPEEPKVIFEVTMTPEDYIAIKRNADWEGMSVPRYVVEHAAGRLFKRGC